MHYLLVTILFVVCTCTQRTPLSRGVFENMNGQYLIANPNFLSAHAFSTDYGTKNVSFFELYSFPIRTVYAQVYWTVQEPIPLPPDIIQKFNNSVMAVTGYEVDQVVKTPNGDVSVPIYWSYNHHYMAWILSGNTTFTSKKDSHGQHIIVSSSYDPYVPYGSLFSEGNGGEYRKSYHGYPAGYAQLIHSPKVFRLQPMQIDTHNRDYHGPGFKAGLLPRESQAPLDAAYSGLLECPCTNRKHKISNLIYVSQVSGKCKTVIDNATDCFNGIQMIGVNATVQQRVSDPSIPSGCSIFRNASKTVAIFNTNANNVTCGGGHLLTGTAKSLVEFSLYLDTTNKVDSQQVAISLTGPVGVWFGVGLNASVMANLPYVIVIDGNGIPSEHLVGDHSEGKVLETQVAVVSSKVVGGSRTVVLSRSMKGLTPEHYSFNPAVTSIPFINAIGSAPQFSYHKSKASSNIVLTAADGITCLCSGGKRDWINNISFVKGCAPEPTGDLLQQKNPTCWLETYAGGLFCCDHETVLLDAEQPVDNRTDEIFLKFRFYYQEYQNHTTSSPLPPSARPVSGPVSPSHLNLHRFYFTTEAFAGEYDVVKCEPESPPSNCIHEITARWKVKDMLDCDPEKDPVNCTVGKNGVQLIYAGGHCHAPSCLSMELYNADTGILICRQEPVYGRGSSDKYDELGYIAIPPCLWGYEEGLIPPSTIYLDTNLMSVKRNNNTFAHYGEMASWQMRGVFL